MIPLRDNLRCKLFPFVTLVIIALNLMAWFYELMVQHSGAMDQFMSTYCFIPAKLTAALQSADPNLLLWAGISVLTAMFLHGSWMHIIGNMLYLYAFGRGMEARLGRWRFVTFYLASGLLATLLQWWADPSSPVPNLGASGAIAGVLGGYLLFWPKARVNGIFLLGPFPIPVNWPAFIYLLAWMGTQLLAVLGPQVADGGVAYFAHIGGFLGGLALAGLWKLYQPTSDVCYVPTDCDCPPPGAGDEHSDTTDSEDDKS